MRSYFFFRFVIIVLFFVQCINLKAGYIEIHDSNINFSINDSSSANDTIYFIHDGFSEPKTFELQNIDTLTHDLVFIGAGSELTHLYNQEGLFVLDTGVSLYIYDLGFSDQSGNNLSIESCFQLKDSSYLDLYNTSFNKIQFRDGAAAVKSIGSTSRLKVSLSEFKNITGAGSCLMLNNVKEASIYHCLFEGNNSGNSAASISMISADSSDLFLDHCNFIKQSTAAIGGAIYCESNVRLYIYDCSFTECEANSGNGIYENAGAIYCDINYLDIAYTAFSNTRAANGGAIYAELDSLSHINHCTFDSCDVFNANNASFGGALYFSNTLIDIFDCHFFDCSANSNGGAIYLQGSTLKIIHSNFELCDATLDGGAISANGEQDNIDSYLEIYESNFINNNAQRSGGAIISEFMQFQMENSSFYQNTAQINAGALLLNYDVHNALINQCTFSSNSSSNSGSAIYLTYDAVDNGGNVHIVNSTFTKNRIPQTGSVFGGAIANAQGQLILGNNIIADNVLGGQPDSRQNIVNNGSLSSLGGNFIGFYTASTTFSQTNDTVGTGSTDPLLAPIGYYDSFTLSHEPHIESPVLNTGIILNNFSKEHDQRGKSRIFESNIDRGSHELQREAICTGADSLMVRYNDLAGCGTLPAAIEYANNHTGFDEVRFDSLSIKHIVLNDVLIIDDALLLNGRSAKGYQDKPRILITANSDVDILLFRGANASNSAVEALAFDNAYTAVYIWNTDDLEIYGNFFGLDTSGVQTDNNGRQLQFAMELDNTDGLFVGNEAELDRNYFCSIGTAGIIGNTVSNTTIAGNYFGTSYEGAIGDFDYGLETAIAIEGLTNSTIGGKFGSSGNLFGYCNEGITLNNSSENKITGNMIGGLMDGTTFFFNGTGGEVPSSGILLSANCTDNLVGSTDFEERNVITAMSQGIVLTSSSHNTITGNHIGYDALNQSFPNYGMRDFGIELSLRSHKNTIGPDNYINYTYDSTANWGYAVHINASNQACDSNFITKNSMSGNTRGIVLSNGNTQANGGKTPPVISTDSLTRTYVAGTSQPGDTIQLFYFYEPLNGTYDEQGSEFIGQTVTQTDGTWSYSPATGAFIDRLKKITATATDVNGNTSEFADYAQGICSDTFLVETNSMALTCGTLPFAIQQANLSAAVDTILFDLPEAISEIVLDNSLEITNPVIIDGTSNPNYNGTPTISMRPRQEVLQQINGFNAYELPPFSEVISIKGFNFYGFSQAINIQILDLSVPTELLQQVAVSNNNFDTYQTIFTTPINNSRGILVQGVNEVYVYDNTINNCEDAGLLVSDCQNLQIYQNTISNCGAGGIYVSVVPYFNATQNSFIQNNSITDNHGGGISLSVADLIVVAGNTIENNYSSENTYETYNIFMDACEFTTIGGQNDDDRNIISGADVGIYMNGRSLDDPTINNCIENNLIAHHGKGIQLKNSSCLQNQFSLNDYECNGTLIYFAEPANDSIEPPQVEKLMRQSIEGKTEPFAKVDLFVWSNCDTTYSASYLASTNADIDGNWSLTYNYEESTDYVVRATDIASLNNGKSNTSVFSKPFQMPECPPKFELEPIEMDAFTFEETFIVPSIPDGFTYLYSESSFTGTVIDQSDHTILYKSESQYVGTSTVTYYVESACDILEGNVYLNVNYRSSDVTTVLDEPHVVSILLPDDITPVTFELLNPDEFEGEITDTNLVDGNLTIISRTSIDNPLIYQVCDVDGNCNQYQLKNEVYTLPSPEEESYVITLYNVLSPNTSDSINSFLFVDIQQRSQEGPLVNVSRIPEVRSKFTIQLVLFDKYGRIIYESDDYPNNANDGFKGKFNGELLPHGTYYYVLYVYNAGSNQSTDELLQKKGGFFLIKY